MTELEKTDIECPVRVLEGSRVATSPDHVRWQELPSGGSRLRSVICDAQATVLQLNGVPPTSRSRSRSWAEGLRNRRIFGYRIAP